MEDTCTFIQNSPSHMEKASEQVNKYYFPTIPLEDEDWEDRVIGAMYDYGEFGEEYPYFNMDDVADFEEEENQEWGVQ